MKNTITKSQLTKIEKFAQRMSKKNDDPFHHFDHAVLTSKIAAYIAKEEGADVTVCKIAGLLHDIAPKTRGEPHGEKSGQLARKFLKKIKVDKEFINQVYLAIAYHDTLKRHLAKTLEGKIIFETDKLQCFGSIGLIREYGDLLIKGYKPEVAVQITINYLKNYNPRFTTKTGRKLKRELQKFNTHFFKLYNKYQRL